MHLIDDVELIPAVRGCVFDVLDDNLPDLVDLSVRGGVKFEHVHRVSRRDLFARIADPARPNGRSLNAVQRFRQDSRSRGFAGSARSHENIGMRETVLLDRILQGASDVVLADDFVERLGPVFSGKNRIAHGMSFE